MPVRFRPGPTLVPRKQDASSGGESIAACDGYATFRHFARNKAATAPVSDQSKVRAGLTQKPLSVFRDLSNYLTGRIVLLFLGFASFPLLTRMLPIAQYGLVSLTLRLVLFLTVFCKCGFQYAVNRFYQEAIADGSPAAQRRYYSTLVFGPLAITLAVLGLYSAGLLVGYKHISDSVQRDCFLLAPPLVLIRVMQSLLLGFLRNQGRSRLHSIFEVATKTLTLVALILLFVSPYHNALAFLAASIISEGIVVLIQVRMLQGGGMLALNSVDVVLIRRCFAFGLPLIAYEFASIVLDSGDRFLVQHFLGDVQLGYYSAAYNIASYLQDIVTSPMNLAFLPIYLQIWNREGPEATSRFLSRALSWFLVCIAFVTSISLLVSQSVIVLLASRRYLQAHELLPVLTLGVMLYATHIFLNAGMVITKKTGVMAQLVTVSAAANIGLNLVLIPRFGNLGAAYATLAGYALLISLMAYVNRKILPIKLDRQLVLSSFAAAACTWLVGKQLPSQSYLFTLTLGVFTCMACFAIVLLALSSTARKTIFGLVSRISTSNTEILKV